MQTEKKQTIPYLQWLRLFAAAAVVVMHTAAKTWTAIGPDAPQWLALTAWDSLVRWPVPVFVMITGALFLPRKTPLRQILTRYVPRMALTFAVWSGIYALYSAGPGGFLSAFVSGHYHLWYLPYLCGVYLMLPFLQKIAEDDRLTKQLLALSAVIALGIPWLTDLAALVLPEQGGLLRTLENQLHFTFFFDHLSLLLLGHVLHRWEPAPIQRRAIYLAGVLSPLLTAAGTVWATRLAVSPSPLFFDHASPTTLLAAVALFLFAKDRLTTLPRAVDHMAGCSFGVYLVHALILDMLADRGIHSLTWDPVWSVPVIAGAVFALSLALTALWKRIFRK